MDNPNRQGGSYKGTGTYPNRLVGQREINEQLRVTGTSEQILRAALSISTSDIGGGSIRSTPHRFKYTDHSKDPIQCVWPFLQGKDHLQLDDSTGGEQNGKKVPFPLLVYRILEESEENETQHIIAWQSHGRAFQVFDREAFETEVMPRYFSSAKFASFSRQLSHYRFIRINHGPWSGAVYHEYFLRGRLDLLRYITRPTAGDRANEPPTIRHMTPNFDSFEACINLSSRAIADLCTDPICDPERVFPFDSSVAMVAQVDPLDVDNYYVPPLQKY